MTDTSTTDAATTAVEQHEQTASTPASPPPTTPAPNEETLVPEITKPPTTISAASPPLSPQTQPTETMFSPTPAEPQVNLPPHVDATEQDAPSLPPRPAEEEQPVHPQVAALLAMFPDFDPAVLQSVLESVGGDQDRAIDTLLSMSDPSYVQEQQPQQRSQTDLDEEFARNLLLENQHQQRIQQQYYQQYNQGQDGQWNPQPGGYDQQPRRQSTGGNKDTMTEVQEQFKQLAESGKKTFSSLVTKVKAKMQEFDQNRTQQSSSSTYQQPPQQRQQFPPSHWEDGSVGGTITTSNVQSQGNWPPAQEQYGSSAVAPQQQYFGEENPTAQVQAQGYDVFAPAVPAVSSQPAVSPRPPSRGSAPPPAPAANIDASKLGLLPKKPVSLLGGGAGGSSSRPTGQDDDDDELDYVENPFEERRK